MQLENQSIDALIEALTLLDGGFSALPPLRYEYDNDKVTEVLCNVAELMKDNYPYFHPFYAGQMLKAPHPVARLAYMLSLWINPNNHALDGGRASSAMEKEAVSQIATLFGWNNALGHLCSGGTMANLEALWVAGQLKPEEAIAASEQAHYTHQRISDVLKLPFRAIPCHSNGQMDIAALENILQTEKIALVVATIGTTGTGSVDPLPEILKLRRQYGFRLHADAAYGGYYILVDNLNPATQKAYSALHEVDSLVIDPHKHGLQPFGCGCVIFKNPNVGALYKHESPYTYFTSSSLHLGEISLECSRPGAAAVALWATQKMLPMVKDGEFAAGLARSRLAALSLYNKLLNDRRFKTIMEPELDIVIWTPQGKRASEISQLSKRLFETAAAHNLHLAIFNYPSALLERIWKDVSFDQAAVTCLRSCLMKPEHYEWIERIWDTISLSMDSVTAGA